MSIGGLILVSLALGAVAWLFFLWSVKSGQYEDPEGPKYRMLEDDEEPRGQGPRKEGEGGGSAGGAPPAGQGGAPRP